jgi:hypothetical protein
MRTLPSALTRDDVLGFVATSATYGNLGLFIGAGFCKAVLNEPESLGIALSWGELLDKASQKMGVDYGTIDKVGRSYPDIASLICGIHSQENNVEFSESLRQLKRGIAEITSWYPTPEQRDKYSRYLETLSPAWIITTNYDLVIETLLTGRSVPLGPNDSLSSRKGVVPIFHLHGVRTNPEEIIIAQEDYISLFRPSQYRQIKLALTIKESTTLFVGYGLGDVNVLTALDWSKNVFKGEQQNYPNDVIQIVRKSNPSESPYRDKNGIVILETIELSQCFEELVEFCETLAQQEEKQRASLNSLADRLKSPDETTIDKFIDDKVYRANMLKVLSKFPVDLIAGFISFLEKCIDKTWKRSIPDGAFEAYNQNLTIILDILTAFSLDRFPPALFQTAAYRLERVGYYIGRSPGQSWSAAATWQVRRSELTGDIVKELRNVAAQYSYSYIPQLLTGIEA